MAATQGKPDLGTCLVTGGSGFLGLHLVRALLDRGCAVRVFDLVPPEIESPRLTFTKGDLRSYGDVCKAMEGVDTVFHVASIVVLLTYPSAAERQRSFEINVRGTGNVIRAARHLGVQRLVYTSTQNVIFAGEHYPGMVDERAHYPAQGADLYTETKAAAEQIVLAANGHDGLLTCALRPSGIYGPGEKLFLPRVIEQCDSGLLRMGLGPRHVLSEATYIDNLVDAHIRAAEHLVPGSVVGGQAYFINDGEYQSNLEFFRPVIEGLGFSFPRWNLPAWPVVWFATLWELAHRFLGAPFPKLTRTEVLKLVVHHPCSIEKAKRDFGYEPLVGTKEGLARCLPYCREMLARREKVERPHWFAWIWVLGGMAAFGIVAFHPDAWKWWSSNAIGWIPRWIYQAGFAVAWLVHVYKGLKAVRIAERAGLRKTSLGWGLQTFLLGFPSMRLLRARVERQGGSPGAA